MTSNLLDLLVAIIVASSVVAGVVAGLARSGIGLLCTILGVLCGFWFYPIPAAIAHSWIHSLMISNVIGFLVIFFPFVILGGIAGRWVMRLFEWTGIGWLDRAAGGLFGLLRGALVSTAFVAVLLAFTPRPVPNWMVNSLVLPYAVTASGALANLAPPTLTEAFRTTLREVREIWAASLEKSRHEIEAMKTSAEEKVGIQKTEKNRDKHR